MIKSDSPDAALTGVFAAHLMAGFEVDQPINRRDDLTDVCYSLATNNAVVLAESEEGSEIQQFCEQMDGFFADIYFLLTKCKITFPDGEEFK